MKAGEVANQPFVIVEFPIERRLPVFAFDRFPTFGKPPAEVLVAAVVDEVEVFAVGDGRAIDGEVLQEDLMRRFLVVPRKSLSLKTQRKQATLDFRGAFDLRARLWKRAHLWLKLIAKQVLDVVDEQLLMLHLVFEA